MAKFVLLNCSITVNGVNFSDHVASVEVALSKKSVDTTNFSGGGFEQVQGLREDFFTVEFQQDFASAEVDATLYPLYNNGTEFTVVVIPVSATVTATNPSYTGTCILLDYMPLSGKPGALSTSKVKFPSQRTGIVRATS
jgi:hypothetical protein